MRKLRTAVVGAALAALIVGACGPGADSETPPVPEVTTPPPAAASPTPGGTLASTLVFGGPPECPQRPFCLLGLEDVYGLRFADFRPLDVGGPITVEALAGGEIDVGLLFSSDPTIVQRDFVVLEDDRGLQRADNLVPVINADLATFGRIPELLNMVSERLTQEELVELNRQFTEDRLDPRDIAREWLAAQELAIEPQDPGDLGRSITVGQTNFYEQDILSEIYGQVLSMGGYTVDAQEATGAREVVFGALEDGQIDILPEYAASALEYLNNGAGEATADAQETTERLRDRLQERGLTALEPAPAQNQNAIVVTRALADQHGLQAISDLAQPEP
jgi:glycine betaine/choline ABC-type transport system substrate-binding protein